MTFPEINSASNRYNKNILLLPSGDVYLDQPILIKDIDNFIVRGRKNTKLIYNGPSSIGAIQMHRTKRCRLENFELVCNVSGVESGVLITNMPGSSPTGRVTTGCTIDSVRIMHDGKPTAFNKGFSIDSLAGGGVDGNNEQHIITNCLILSYAVAGLYLRGSQVHQIVFDNCRCSDYGNRRPYGLWAYQANYFKFVNGSMTNNSVDFYCEGNEIISVIENSNGEHSSKFLVKTGTSAEYFMDIRNVRWEGAPVENEPIIQFFGKGPVNISNAMFVGISGVCPKLSFTQGVDGNGYKRGGVSLKNIMLRQHGGTIPETPLIVVPDEANYKKEIFNVKHQYVDGETRTDTYLDFNTAI